MLSTFLRTYAFIVFDSTSYWIIPASIPLPPLETFVEVAEAPRLVFDINIEEERFIS